MGIPRRALATLIPVMLLTSPAAALPVVLDFDTLPPPPWEETTCFGGTASSVSGGVLTIETPDCAEWRIMDPAGEWHQKVDNAKGWAVEARLRIDPISEEHPGSTVLFWINDHTNMLVVGLTKTEVRLEYPEYAGAPMNTTDAFHVIRIMSKLDVVRIYVDGVLRVDHTLTYTGAGTNALDFGDGDGAGYSLSYWDYFSYDVDCAQPGCEPTATCVTGAPCDDGDACTQGDVCTSGVCAGSPVTCPAVDDCHDPGTCLPTSGCTHPAKPDGTPCSGGVCLSGACTAIAGEGGAGGGSGGSGGRSPGNTPYEDTSLHGRGGCYCEVGRDRESPPAWLFGALFAARWARKRARARQATSAPAARAILTSPP